MYGYGNNNPQLFLDRAGQQPQSEGIRFLGGESEAQRILQLVNDSGAPQNFKDAFSVNGDRLIIGLPNNLNELGVNWRWIEQLAAASSSGAVDVAFATADPNRGLVNIEDSVKQKIGRWITAPSLDTMAEADSNTDEGADVPSIWGLSIDLEPERTLGLTLPGVGESQPTHMVGGVGAGENQHETSSSSPIGYREDARILLLVTDREINDGNVSARDSLDILKTFFHEAAAHAGLLAQGENASHAPGPPNYYLSVAPGIARSRKADIISYRIELAFRSPRAPAENP